jgi:hypothetical protein
MVQSNHNKSNEKILFLSPNNYFSELVPPFAMGVMSLNAAQGSATGFNLDYSQVPCH